MRTTATCLFPESCKNNSLVFAEKNFHMHLGRCLYFLWYPDDKTEWAITYFPFTPNAGLSQFPPRTPYSPSVHTPLQFTLTHTLQNFTSKMTPQMKSGNIISSAEPDYPQHFVCSFIKNCKLANCWKWMLNLGKISFMLCSVQIQIVMIQKHMSSISSSLQTKAVPSEPSIMQENGLFNLTGLRFLYW